MNFILVAPLTFVIEGDCKLKGGLQRKFLMQLIGLLVLIQACQMLQLLLRVSCKAGMSIRGSAQSSNRHELSIMVWLDLKGMQSSEPFAPSIPLSHLSTQPAPLLMTALIYAINTRVNDGHSFVCGMQSNKERAAQAA